MTEAIATIDHARRLGYCSRGMRAFFELHALDWQQFRDRGLPADVIEATGDAMAIKVAALAREDAAKGEA